VKIAVLVKRVPDTASVFKIAADGRSVAGENLKYVMSPYDEHAVEEAIKIQETSGAEVIVFSLGDDTSQETMRTALAMGADRGVLVSAAGLSSRGVAVALAEALRRESPDLILAGKQAVDDDASQVPERVAELLDMPHASVVTRLVLDGGKATVDREVEGGKLTLELPLPCVLTIEKGINTPRYPKLPNIMKAKSKPLATVAVGDLGLDAGLVENGAEVLSMSTPSQARRTKIIDGDTKARVAELVRALREDDKAL
jgi:electron transfer flavoprotein beta subunit